MKKSEAPAVSTCWGGIYGDPLSSIALAGVLGYNTSRSKRDCNLKRPKTMSEEVLTGERNRYFFPSPVFTWSPGAREPGRSGKAA